MMLSFVEEIFVLVGVETQFGILEWSSCPSLLKGPSCVI
jgi:hypothetical protein